MPTTMPMMPPVPMPPEPPPPGDGAELPDAEAAGGRLEVMLVAQVLELPDWERE